METTTKPLNGNGRAVTTTNEAKPFKIADLFAQDPQVSIPIEQLNEVLAQAPPSSWVKVHPLIGHKYLPIDKVEYLLLKCFKTFQIEVKSVTQLLNSICCVVRVHYYHPVLKTMMYHDGVASAELQTVAKSGPLKLDMSNVNHGAVTMATGIAKSLAIKDACDHFGNLFGANLNRKDTLNYTADQNILNA